MLGTERATLIQGLQSWLNSLQKGKVEAVMAGMTESLENILKMEQCDRCGQYFPPEQMDVRFCKECAAVQDEVDRHYRAVEEDFVPF